MNALDRQPELPQDRSGLVAGGRDKADGRRVVLSVTGDGHALIRKVAPESHAVFADIEACYCRERMETLLDRLGDLAALK